MRVIENNDVSLRVIFHATETQSPKSEITINGTSLNLIIDGVYIEACIEHNEGYLIFTTNDCPFEESLNIYLASRENKILDQATAFSPYSTGSFKPLRTIDPDFVQFEFFSGKVWQIQIFKKSRLYIPYFSEPSCVWRKVKFLRFFRISEVNHPVFGGGSNS